MHVYIAGPMRGLPDFNFPAFHEAERRLSTMGHASFNPARHDEEMHGVDTFVSPDGDLADLAHLDFDLRHSLASDLAFICEKADGLVVLSGWENSKGACAEVATAAALGLPVYRITYVGSLERGFGLTQISPALFATEMTTA